VFDTVVIVTIEGENVDDEFLENVGKLHGVEKVDLVGHAAPDLRGYPGTISGFFR
jgi:hypothetical protein